MKRITIIWALCCIIVAQAQDYTSYFTGDVADTTTNHESGICLMGGATENDDAMIWFLERADGGDVLVLRASGSDGYNNYFYSALGVTINSVETLVIHNANGAIDPYVLQQVANAEAIWFAGGDQYDYVSYFKDTAMEEALNTFINTKNGVIGGTSAGMAILGGNYFDASNGTVTSAQALANPYDSRVSLGYGGFLEIPRLENVITDTHYDDPDRKGRHTTFMARIATDTGTRPLGIACEEFSAVCIDAEGYAYAFGGHPTFEDYVYFIQPNCSAWDPETCTSGTPLTWIQDNNALRVLKVPANSDDQSDMYLADNGEWIAQSGTQDWNHWTADDGLFAIDDNGADPECEVLEVTDLSLSAVTLSPNPASQTVSISAAAGSSVQIFSISGKLMREIENYDGTSITITNWSRGVYFVKLQREGSAVTLKLLKE